MAIPKCCRSPVVFTQPVIYFIKSEEICLSLQLILVTHWQLEKSKPQQDNKTTNTKDWICKGTWATSWPWLLWTLSPWSSSHPASHGLFNFRSLSYVVGAPIPGLVLCCPDLLSSFPGWTSALHCSHATSPISCCSSLASLCGHWF